MVKNGSIFISFGFFFFFERGLKKRKFKGMEQRKDGEKGCIFTSFEFFLE